MLKAVFLIACLAIAIGGIAAEKKIVCYYGSWSAYRPGLGKFEVSNINPSLCTHMIYTFVGLNLDGSIQVLDSWLDLPSGKDGFGQFTRLRQSNPGTKAIIAIGGWNEGSAKYSQVAGNPSLRAAFVQNAVNFLRRYNFDGLDVDWEYPNQRGGIPADRENYIQLLKELRQEFDKYGYSLSAAVAAAEPSASQSYYIQQVSQYLDFINLMAYDFNGSWNNYAGINAPLYASNRDVGDKSKENVNEAVRYWLSQGAPREKLILGVPAYGRTFTLANPNDNAVGAPTVSSGPAGPYTREAGTLGYNEICEYIKQGGWTVKRDSEQHVPYAFKGSVWVGYDDVQSLQEKANFINSMNLGGAMMWSIETDDFHGVCGETYPLLKALNRVLRGDASTATAKPPVADVPNEIPRPPPSPPPSAPPAPAEHICQRQGHVRDPDDCAIFYYCQNVNGQFVAIQFRCAPGLAFDPAFNGCNYASLVVGC